MAPLIRPVLLVSILVSLVVVVVVVASSIQQELPETPDTRLPKKYGLGKLLDYRKFKRHFHKRYLSSLEDLSRQKIYMSRMLRVASSSLAFAQRKSSSFLSINQMSDWSKKEFEKTMIDEKKRKKLPPPPSAEEKRRSFFSLRRRTNSMDESGRVRPKSSRVSSNDTPDQPGEPTEDNTPQVEVPSTTVMDKLKSTIRVVSPKAAKIISELTGRSLEAHRDHRRSGCLQGEPKDQGQCASCFVFSTMALYEWMYCKGSAGLARQFSEQYVLDCGAKVGLAGCSGGGQEGYVGLFTKKYGVELADRYSYEAKVKKCPYNKQDHQKMGVGHFSDASIKQIPADEFDEFLSMGPILTGVYVSSKFQDYGGGVDDGRGCDSPNRRYGHAMLLIGDGREHGQDYWLFRNSHGPAWGEQGYYKLAKSSACMQIDDGIGYVPATLYFEENDYSFKWNGMYDKSIVDGRTQKLGFLEGLFG